MTIGEKIYNLRIENKLSQEELASEVKVSRHTIGKWENDTVSPSTENLSRLCKVFKVDANYFLGEQNEVAVTEPSKSGKVSVYKVLLITLLSLLGVAFIVADVFLGLLVFSKPGSSGDDYLTSPVTSFGSTSTYVFWIMIAVTIVFIVGVAFALYLYKKHKNKKVNY